MELRLELVCSDRLENSAIQYIQDRLIFPCTSKQPHQTCERVEIARESHQKLGSS